MKQQFVETIKIKNGKALAFPIIRQEWREPSAGSFQPSHLKK